MTATLDRPPTPPQGRPQREEPPAKRTAQARPMSTGTPAAAGLSVVLASTALVGAVEGIRWVVFVAVATAVVVAAGALLRSITLRSGRALPPAVVVAGQVFALTSLLTAVFTRSGLLVLLPTPTSLRDIGAGLSDAMAQVESGVPPVEATPEMLLLITFALGLVAVVVDFIAVSARAPAAAGLVLLCVFAVPASVSDGLLPWWTFVLGAGGFALLLVVDGQRRHLAWRGESTAPSDRGAGPAATAVAGVALIAALLAGSSLTLIGTIGRLPGAGSGAGSGGTTGVGLKPFTSLRGQLNREGVLELFRVRGLDRQAYLRALTLREYSTGEGWVVQDGFGGDPLGENLPMPPDQYGEGQQATIEIETLRFRDAWLPVFGVPTGLAGAPGGYRYDPAAGTVFSDRARRPGSYIEQALFPEPPADELRSAGGQDDIDPEYLRLEGVDQRVNDLAVQVTAEESSRFDKVLALNDFFTSGDFTYSEQTAQGGSEDALVDFLFNGKTGYCEQFASSMAVMLRAISIPSRVVIGFTSGYESGDTRVITTQDAHAWVEVFFPGLGWTAFDPTPLVNGRGITPPYVSSEANRGDEGLGADEGANPSGAPSASAAAAVPTAASDAVAAPVSSDGGGGGWLQPLLIAVLVLALLVAVVAGPATVRRLQRRSRLQAVTAGGPGAATAAWRELLAESWDRGVAVRDTDTVRMAAGKLAREHGLDDDGRRGLRSVVGAIERSWYGAGNRTDAGLRDALREVLDSFTRSAPLALRSKLLPRSVLRPRTSNDPHADD